MKGKHFTELETDFTRMLDQVETLSKDINKRCYVFMLTSQTEMSRLSTCANHLFLTLPLHATSKNEQIAM